MNMNIDIGIYITGIDTDPDVDTYTLYLKEKNLALRYLVRPILE
jgi:hypothetical protein